MYRPLIQSFALMSSVTVCHPYLLIVSKEPEDLRVALGLCNFLDANRRAVVTAWQQVCKMFFKGDSHTVHIHVHVQILLVMSGGSLALFYCFW